MITPKYTFSQIVKLSKPIDEKKDNTVTKWATKKIKKVFFPAAVREYNLRATKKIFVAEENLKIEDIGNATLLLSVNGKLKDLDIYKFIFQKMVKNLSEDTKESNDYRKKILAGAKTNLEHRLVEINDIYKKMTKKYFPTASEKRESAYVENGIIAMYLNNQELLTAQLSNSIDVLQEQIMEIYNTKAVSDFIASEQPIGPSKIVLLGLVL